MSTAVGVEDRLRGRRWLPVVRAALHPEPIEWSPLKGGLEAVGRVTAKDGAR